MSNILLKHKLLWWLGGTISNFFIAHIEMWFTKKVKWPLPRGRQTQHQKWTVTKSIGGSILKFFLLTLLALNGALHYYVKGPSA